MYSGDDHSHHPWQGRAFKRTTEEISESLAGLHLALFQVTSHVVHNHVVYDLCIYMAM